MRRTLPLIVSCLISISSNARADSWAPPKSDSEAMTLFALDKEKRTSIAVEGSKFRAARADVIVDAPLASVRNALVDHQRYGDIIPSLSKVKVLKKSGEGAEVFLQLPIMKGASSIWAVERFDAPIAEGKNEKIVGHFVKGNVDALRTVWRFRAIDATHTLLSLEMYVAPQFAMAVSTVNGEVENACADGVKSARSYFETATKKSTKP